MQIRSMTSRGLALAMLVATALLFVSPASAQSTEKTFKLGPGGTAKITFVAYCTEFGKFFPEQIANPNGSVAAAPIPAALQYIASKGYTSDEAKALEANFAIWQLAGATRATGGADLTKEIKDNAKTAPSAPAGAVSILDAAKDGRVQLTVQNWKAIGDKVQILSATDHFYGRGELVVVNTSTDVLTLYMPTGTVFPGSEARFQQMGGYAEDVNVTEARLPVTGDGTAINPALFALAALALIGMSVGVRRMGTAR